MSFSELFGNGLKLMGLGMGMVFVFLVLMICLMKLMSKALAPFSNFLAEPPKSVKHANKAGASNDAELAAAAVAAVEIFRRK